MPPERYEKMRDKFQSQGLSRDQAQEKAARIYNSRRKPGQAPVTGRSPIEESLHKIKPPHR